MPFDGRLLSGVTVLAAVVESGSFARAADAIGITTSGVSRAVARLEARIGARLLDRTTRSIALTDEGRRFYETGEAQPCQDRGRRDRRLGRDELVRGRLRVDIDPVVSSLILPGRLGKFLGQYPELSLECMTREQIGDLVGDGIDVAVRFGEPAASSLIRPETGRAAGHHRCDARLSETPRPPETSERPRASRLHSICAIR